MPTIEVELLQPSRYKEAGILLGRAFNSDPAWCYLCPDPAKRPSQLTWMFERWCRVLGPLGACYIGKKGEGVAMWFPPDKGPQASLWTYIRAGLGTAPFRLGLSGIRRALLLNADMKKRWAGDLKQPCWKLDVLGVDPNYQRQGVGTALLQPILERADSEGTPCHVITHNPANIVYYGRHGFQLLHRAEQGYLANSLWRPAPDNPNREKL